MKAKWIKVYIRRRVDAWRDSITDTQLRADLSDKVIVTGGCIASMLLGERPNDIDVYFRDAEIARRVADYYVAKWNAAKDAEYQAYAEKPKGPGRPRAVPVPVTIRTKAELPEDEAKFMAEHLADSPGFKIYVKSAGIVGEGNLEDYAYFEGVDPGSGAQDAYLDAAAGDQPDQVLEEGHELAQALATEDERPDYRPVFVSANAISLHGRMQLIFRFVGDPDNIHANYDFVHCTNYWTSWEGLTLKPEALEALLTKELRYVGSRYPVCSVFRVRKFLNRGFTITAGQLFKICWQISKLDLSDFRVLEDQLVGVDAAYFTQVLDALRGRDTFNGSTVDETYMLTLIDKVF